MVTSYSFRTSVFLALVLGLSQITMAATYTLDASQAPPVPETGYFKMGTAENPSGTAIGVNSRSLLRDRKPWVPVMGEFHFARCPEREWRDELLKMKAGGIDIAASYVFWIHHEEIEGEWDWSGQRNLRKFVETARDVGLDVAVRLGPWCHGEVRNGGHPDWLLAKGWKLRTNDPQYIEKARILYQQIAAQLTGLVWKEGGPVVAVQVENECNWDARYLLTLKQIARDVGLDVPLYTRTGWPIFTRGFPLGELLPLYGGYAEGFWDREITSMPGGNGSTFYFSSVRASDIFGESKGPEEPGIDKYPFLTCETGGGMAVSYHRRILIDPMDVEAPALVKIGSGGTPGYYMYHGGTNPDGKRTSLQESQETGMPNDLPEKTYDFQAPLGEFGQVRPHFHSLRLPHLFLREFGEQFAGMTPRFPDKQPTGKNDTQTLRWAVRSDGEGGALFVNNYMRAREMQAHEETQFRIKLASREVVVPREPTTIPADSVFFWPLNFDLGGVKLLHATAQPICRVEADGKTFTFFAETKGVPAEFAFDTDVTTTGAKTQRDGLTIVKGRSGTGAALEVRKHVLVLLNSETARDCYKATWQGKERVFLSSAVVVPDGDSLRLLANNTENIDVRIFPSPEKLKEQDHEIVGQQDGVFRRFVAKTASRMPIVASLEQVQAAGPARDVLKGAGGVASAPVGEDLAQAAVWRVKLPAGLDPKGDYLLRVHYKGDVIRAYLGEQFLTDDFYNGNAFELGLKRFAPAVFDKELLMKVLPLRINSPIFLEDKAKPDFGDQQSVVAIDSVELIERREVCMTVP